MPRVLTSAGMRLRAAILALVFVAGVAAAASPAEQAAESRYDKPPQYVLDVLHAPAPPVPYVNPTNDRILLVAWVEYPPMAQVAPSNGVKLSTTLVELTSLTPPM